MKTSQGAAGVVQWGADDSLDQDRHKGWWMQVKVMVLPKRMQMGGSSQESVLQIQSVLA